MRLSNLLFLNPASHEHFLSSATFPLFSASFGMPYGDFLSRLKPIGKPLSKVLL
ncbi:hypothetical protein NEOC95_000264 [Neochlamydia sp. AcF95]|nr:hypothetical protein [Neochlamydia sp. AcF95]